MTLSFDIRSSAQSVDNLVWANSLKDQIEFLSSPMCEGRAPGSKGSTLAAFWLCEEFKAAGLTAFGKNYAKSFEFGDDKIGHNIVGLMPGSKKVPRSKYIIIAAHYDHLGTINGTLYPGADSNASGVVALVNILRMFSHMKSLGHTYDCNIIFVALDAKEAGMVGSEAFYEKLSNGFLRDPINHKNIYLNQIKMVINIDQIGSSLSPLKSGREDFIIMLGNQTMPKEDQDMAQAVNRIYKTDLEIGFDYYGSARFTDVFFKRVTDLKPFVAHGTPSILFTSGITMKTNKPDDTLDSLNIGVLRRRIIFMFHWIENML